MNNPFPKKRIIQKIKENNQKYKEIIQKNFHYLNKKIKKWKKS